MPQAHLFCRVVDNYGDIGIAWRLAATLAARHGFDVTLFLDVPAALAPLAPHYDPHLPDQVVEGVRVATQVHIPQTHVDLVIEILAGTAPEAYVAAMATQTHPPAWFIYEYLTAEDFATTHHLAASPHPRYNFPRFFFYPGMRPGTGGLLAPLSPIPLVQNPVASSPPDPLRVFLFSYDNSNLLSLCSLWARGPQRVELTVPIGPSLNAIASFLGQSTPITPNTVFQRGALSIHVIDMVPQYAFFPTLSRFDLNFIRGEDSMSLAAQTGHPLVWHIYPQDDQAHHIKLQVFLDLYAPGHAPTHHLMRAWNGMGGDIETAWADYVADWPRARANAARFQAAIMDLGDAVQNLVDFYYKIR